MKKFDTSKKEIKRQATLAQLEFSPKVKTFKKMSNKVAGWGMELEGVNTKKIAPLWNLSPNINITRKDIPSGSLTQKEALQNAPKTKNGMFVTKGVFK